MSLGVLKIPLGQSGLNLGARLQALNISCLIVDKNERVGDNWRKRYRVCPLLCNGSRRADRPRL
jgi:cation diffusion facilitator CzcD-associated flavoprotein CzcO